jgi:hypothetical protein
MFLRLGACSAALLTLLFSQAPLRAAGKEKITSFTFNSTVQIPGKTLAAGTYEFKIATPNTDVAILKVTDARGKTFYATCRQRRDIKIDRPATLPTMLYYEMRTGVPPAARAMFFPGDQSAFELVYSGPQAREISRTSEQRDAVGTSGRTLGTATDSQPPIKPSHQ